MTVNQIYEACSCMAEMEHNAKIWTMTKTISGILESNFVNYDEMCEIFTNIMHYNHHVAEVEGYLTDDELDIDGDDGEDFFVRGI